MIYLIERIDNYLQSFNPFNQVNHGSAFGIRQIMVLHFQAGKSWLHLVMCHQFHILKNA